MAYFGFRLRYKVLKPQTKLQENKNSKNTILVGNRVTKND